MPRTEATTHAGFSARAATPWDALLYQPPLRRLPPAEQAAQGGARDGSKLAGLLALLGEMGAVQTLTLAVCADLTSRQVWGLLKAPRDRGQVTFERGRWSLVPGYVGQEVERAAELLRRHGWRVERPSTGDAR